MRHWFQESELREELVLITKDCHPVIDSENLFAKPLETALGALNVELNPEEADFRDLNF